MVSEGRAQDDGAAEDALHTTRNSGTTQLFAFEAGAVAVAIGGSLLAYWTFGPMLRF